MVCCCSEEPLHVAYREDVGRHVTTKSTKEIKDYYNDMYVNSVIGEGSIRANPHQSHLERHGGRGE